MSPTEWTLAERAKCADLCAEFGDPACWEIGDYAPCADCRDSDASYAQDPEEGLGGEAVAARADRHRPPYPLCDEDLPPYQGCDPARYPKEQRK